MITERGDSSGKNSEALGQNALRFVEKLLHAYLAEVAAVTFFMMIYDHRQDVGDAGDAGQGMLLNVVEFIIVQFSRFSPMLQVCGSIC